MKDLDIDTKSLPVKSVQITISRAKDKMITPEAFYSEVGNDYRLKQIGRIYEAYQNKLKSSNALDFDDIIMQTVVLLRQFPEVREYYQNRFRYVCVDEYQDTNEAQFALTALLSGGYGNIMVVGDDDQSIYKFRQACPDLFLEKYDRYSLEGNDFGLKIQLFKNFRRYFK